MKKNKEIVITPQELAWIVATLAPYYLTNPHVRLLMRYLSTKSPWGNNTTKLPRKN